MAVFVIIPTANEAQIAATLNGRVDLKKHQMPKGEWLVSYEGTSKMLSDELGISDGANGTGAVFSIGGYYGRAPTDIWEWLKQNMTGT